MPRGFTLVELLIVIALVATISAIGLIVGLESYQRTLQRNDEDTIRIALLHARSQALNGVCAAKVCTGPSAHGVYVGDSGFVIFEGGSYFSRHEGEDIILEGKSDALRSGLAEVVFSPLTGKVSLPGEVRLTDAAGKISITAINSEGAVLWGK
ncbi:MAG: prepilin-type N-terminal cleavage/methylation domain-containing protein [bacterium]